jgi:hypothetical protein
LNYISSGNNSNSNNNDVNNNNTNQSTKRFDCDPSQSLVLSNSTSSTSIQQTIPECKVWKNPMSLLRGAEYSKLTSTNSKEPLTFYDMNLSAQDHQTFFSCDLDEGKLDYEIMQRAWRERNPNTRIMLAQEALEVNQE